MRDGQPYKMGKRLGNGITVEAAAFVVFTVASFVAAIRALRDAG